ncbi:MAG: dehydrogenase [Acidiferrobacteraceae bacterium]|nr:dehydrogenase [Acidiferrobacteraceae bacterium]|tara:strand:- start:102 stop:932 length:831 start_codon:yes stop_codon:yes gene_type:complete
MADLFLRGKSAIVTGGASGLGLEIAKSFAKHGANIAVVSLTQANPAKLDSELKYFASENEIQSTKKELESIGVMCLGFDGDVSRQEDVDRVMKTSFDTFGSIDILINNAATNCIHTILNHDNTAWKRIIDVNLFGSYLCVREALPFMIQSNWGRIISIASTNAHVGTAEYSAYVASKHGLLGFNKSLAQEVAEHQITANTISPAAIETPSGLMHLAKWAEREGIGEEVLRKQYLDTYPQKRFVTAGEVAALATFLCRDEAAAINGEDIAITTGAPF